MSFFPDFIISFLLLFISVNAVYGQHYIYSYSCCPAETPVTVDGKLDDKAWDKAVLIDNFVNNSDNEKSPFQTRAKMLYDKDYLYVCFYCSDTNIWSVKTNRDEHLWEEEVVEVFLQPDTNKLSYIEVEINPLGTILDGFMIDSLRQLPYEEWNLKDIKSAVQVSGTIDGKEDDSAWTCEVAIPLNEITSGKTVSPGDVWHFNLYRAELKPGYQLISWSPTYRDDFHLPSYFGRLVFNGKVQ